MSRTSWWAPAAAGAFLLLGFVPLAPADGAASALVGWLALPFQALGDAEAMALGSGLRSEPAREIAASESLLELRRRELENAIAGDPTLKSRPGVAANVRSYDPEEARLTLDSGSTDGIQVGDPATFGDALVGVVDRVEASSSTVRLTSHRAVRLCARVRTPVEARLVARGSGAGRLRVELTQRRDIPDGAAVEASTAPGGDRLDLAAGFLVGTFRRDEATATAAIEPPPECAPERLLQVIVRVDHGPATFPVDDRISGWERVDFSPAGDLLAGRSTMLGRIAKRAAPLRGAAVAFDGWLVGRIARAGGPTVRARCAEDPGFEVDAILLPPSGRPLPLGRVRTVAVVDGGMEVVPVSGTITLPSQAAGPLLTGNGEFSVPKGLRIGDARVTDGRLFVARPFRGAEVTSAFVAIARDPQN